MYAMNMNGRPVKASANVSTRLPLENDVTSRDWLSNDVWEEYYTVPRCKRLGAWGDVCTYKNLCWDGTSYLMFHKYGSKNYAKPGKLVSVDDMLEGLIFPMNPVPSTARSFVPFNGDFMRVRRMHPSALFNLAGNHHASGVAIESNIAFNVSYTWQKNVMWRLPFRYPIKNIWYTASRVLPLYHARIMNESGWFHPPLPSLDVNDFMFTDQPAEPFNTDWTRQVIAIASGNRSRVEFGDGPWNKQWNSNNVVCFRNAVATGAFAAGVPDVETAFKFRADAYKAMGVALPSTPAKKVLFWLRGYMRGRSFINEDDVVAVAKAYNLSYTVVIDHPESFKEQLELFASHGVIVSPHGAGLMNVMFMPPLSAVVEIFPYHFDHNIYSLAATTSGLGYYPVHTYNGTDVWSRHKPNFDLKCEDLTSLQMNWVDGDCRDGPIYHRMHVGLRDFEAALVNAINHAGYRVLFRGIGPVRDNSTDTGWT